ncbi:MAG: DUF2232 domain-containing protein [Actinomyces sp.]|nr:DUF2232 domain-containing protein [Actinomyces sp.]MCI1642762.1 DUF2232 domain-containing protein [Actinomyces sp.]
MTSQERQPRYGRMRSDYAPEELAGQPPSIVEAAAPSQGTGRLAEQGSSSSTEAEAPAGGAPRRPRRHGQAPEPSMPTPPPPPRHGPLTPVEVATVGILGGLAVVLGVVSTILPFFQGLFQMLAAVPIAMVAVRLRPRGGVAAVAVTMLVALMLGGASSAVTVGEAALGGAVVGALLRRRVGLGAAAAAGLTLGGAIGAATLGVLWVLADLRDLVLESARVSVTGYLDLFGRWSVLTPLTDRLTRLVTLALDWWYVVVPAGVLLGVAGMVVLAFWILRIVLARLRLGSDWDPLQVVLDRQAGAARPTGSGDDPASAPDPLPIRLSGVRYRYPGAPDTAGADALRDVDLEVRDGEFTVVVGPNGSGKSTLSLVLAGAEPSAGRVERPGPVGLGRRGGTALLAQRSELQMLGETVAEDVVWGLPPEERAEVDVEDLLALVGLEGLGAARTSHLSGGQLQRLALAGALARRPRLLLSDESTAMVDPAGRADLMRILGSLPARGTTVVHVTHDPVEARGADRLIRMEAGRVISDGPVASSDAPSGTDEGVPAPAPRGARAPAEPPAPVEATPEQPWPPAAGWSIEHLWADRITHAYDVGTPWEHVVLRDVSLIVSPGEAVLITGGNGSGKTTLSRLLTGLIAPTWGRCTLGGTPVAQRVGDVAMSMQFARLQLQRPSVRLDILAAARAGTGSGADAGVRSRGRRTDDTASRPAQDRLVRSAMDEVGLPLELERRGIDQLSGGQMRRVALAGLLASEPRVIVLDEPLAGLDADSRLLLIDALERRRRRGLAIVVISHDTDGLDALCQRSLTLAEGTLS